MSFTRAFFPALALLHCGSSPGVAHVGDRLLLIPELSDEDLLSVDVHDGGIDEWFRLVGEPVATDADFKLRPHDFGGPSMQFRVWLAWHAGTSRIYAAVQTVDDIYVNLDSGEHDDNVLMLQNDTFLGIGVDGDHSGDRDYIWLPSGVSPDNMTAYHRRAQEYYAIGVAVGSPGHIGFAEFYYESTLPLPLGAALSRRLRSLDGAGSYGHR